MTTIRPANPSDSAFIARSVFMAFLVDMERFSPEQQQSLLNKMTAVCEREDTFYSWCNTIIAEVDGQTAGIAIAYDGARYTQMRQVTIPIITQFMDAVFGPGFEDMPDEAGPGEFYLDTLAVQPEFRHHGIATRLIESVIGKAGKLTCTLAVDPVNDRARRLYESIGFKETRIMRIFGEDYCMMSL